MMYKGITTRTFNFFQSTRKNNVLLVPQRYSGSNGEVTGFSPFSHGIHFVTTKSSAAVAAVSQSRNQIFLTRKYETGCELDSDVDQMKLYPTHISTTLFQKLLLGVGASVVGLMDPRRADMVAVSGEALGQPALKKMLEKMKANPEGQQILRDRPIINSTTTDLKHLKTLPSHTFGRKYIKFLEDNNVTPDSRDVVRFVDNAECMYVMLRYRQVHDFLHAILEMPTNMLGEVTVKWVEGIQTGLPMCVGGGLLGPLRFGPKQRKKYISTYLPWALKVGFNMKFYMNIYFEKRWEQPVDELRRELNIECLSTK